MADRPISGLTEATSMTNADLFAISQGGQAKKVTWETFYSYLAEALDGHGGISNITYTPPASGSRTGTMTINYADGSSPTTVEVTDGKEITAITQYFAVSSSSSTVPSTWYTTRQTLTAEDKYLWSYFEFAFNDPESEPLETPKTVIGVYGDKGDEGDKGDTGNGITSVDYVGTLDMVDTYRITFDNGTTTTFTVTNGSSIAEVKYLSSSGLVDTYEITLTTGETSTFDVTNGKSITAIVPVDVTHASGHTDVYRIDYNDGDSFTFYIYNGTNGTGSVSRVDGIAADGTQDVPLLLLGQGAPTPTTVGELKQRYFDQTNNVLYICTGIDTSTPETTYNWQGAGVTVDSAFSSTSTNPVQNAIITGKVGTSSLNTTAQNLSDAINEHETDLTGKVDKVTGKGLSTNDFTNGYKNKIGTATLNTTAQDLSGAINELVSSKKNTQTAKTSPSASGNALAFIDTITQDVQGVITATKKNVTIDSALGSSSNPVQNSAVNTAINNVWSSLNSAHIYFAPTELGLTGTPTMKAIVDAMPNHSVGCFQNGDIDQTALTQPFGDNVSVVTIFKVTQYRTIAFGGRAYNSVSDTASRYAFASYDGSAWKGWFAIVKEQELRYKANDTFTPTSNIVITGVLTGASKEMYFDFVTDKSMESISSISVTKFTGGIRQNGSYVNGSSDSYAWVGQSGITVSATKLSNYHARISIIKTSAFSGVTNNDMVVALVGLTLKFT